MAGSGNPSRSNVLFGPPINWNSSKSDVDTISLSSFRPRYETHTSPAGQLRSSLAASDRSVGASLNSESMQKPARPVSSTVANSSSIHFDDEDDAHSQSSYRPSYLPTPRTAGSLQLDQSSSSSKAKTRNVFKNNANMSDSVELKGSMVVAHYEYLEGMRTTTPVKPKSSPAVASSRNRQPTTPRSATKPVAENRYSLRKARAAASTVSETSSVDTSASYRSSAVSQGTKLAKSGMNSPLHSARSQQHRLRSGGANEQGSTGISLADKRSIVSEPPKEPSSSRMESSKNTPLLTPRSNVSLRQPNRQLPRRPIYHDDITVGARDQMYDEVDSSCNSLVDSREEVRDRYSLRKGMRDSGSRTTSNSGSKSTSHSGSKNMRASDVSIGQHVTPAAAIQDDSNNVLADATCGKSVKQLPPLHRVDDSIDQDSTWSRLLHEKLRESHANPFLPGPRAVRNSTDVFQYRSSAAAVPTAAAAVSGSQDVKKSAVKSASLEFPKLKISHPFSDGEKSTNEREPADADSEMHEQVTKISAHNVSFRISEEKVDVRASGPSAAATAQPPACNASVDKLPFKDTDVGVVEVDAMAGGDSDQEEIVVYKHPHSPSGANDKQPGCKCCTIM